MAQATTIAWTDLSWNPTHGCSRVSTGCKHCYAETLSQRYGQTPKPWTERNAAENVLLKPHKLREPLSSAKAWQGLGTAAAAAGKTAGKLVFVNSMSDLFHKQIPDEYIWRVFATMVAAERHTFQVLTKRPGRMRDMLSDESFWLEVRLRANDLAPGTYGRFAHIVATSPPPNVWLGVSIENRKWVGRADVLRETPAAVRFISAEPLLGPLVGRRGKAERRCDVECCDLPATWHVPLSPVPAFEALCPGHYRRAYLDLTGIGWLIVGGESGSGHRPFDPEWARDLRDACTATGTAYFLKQMGGARPGTALEDLPEDLRMREFPTAAVAA
jgi:protein gp37